MPTPNLRQYQRVEYKRCSFVWYNLCQLVYNYLFLYLAHKRASLPSEFPHRDEVSDPLVLCISTTWVDDIPLLFEDASKDCAPRCKWWDEAESV